MLSFEFLIDNIFVIVGGRVFQKTVGIHMGTNCAPLLADLFPYSYEADFIQGFLKKNEKKPSRSFNFTFRYIDDVLSPNNSRFGDFVHRIYPIIGLLHTLIPWPTSRNWQLGAVKNKTLRQKIWFQFSYCELSIHMFDIPELVVPIRISSIEGCC